MKLFDGFVTGQVLYLTGKCTFGIGKYLFKGLKNGNLFKTIYNDLVKKPIKFINKKLNKEKSKKTLNEKFIEEPIEKPIKEQSENNKDNNGRGRGYDPKLTSQKNRLPKRAFDPSGIINRQRGKTNMEREY